MSDRMTTELVASTLQQALTHRKPPIDLIHHLDRSSQYTSIVFRKLLKAQYYCQPRPVFNP